MKSMFQFLSTVASQSLAILWRLSARTALFSVASTVMFVSSGSANSNYTTAQEARDSDPSLSSPALEHILGVADPQSSGSQSSEPSTTELHDGGAVPPPLSELDFNRIPSPFAPDIPLSVDLSQLVLIPNRTTVSWLDKQFEVEVAPINSRIAFRQELLEELLSDPDSNDDRIRQVQSILSQLRAERDRIAIEHLLLVRQVSESGLLPTQATNSRLE